jgi:tripartite-type tricarboxylate transporter receptor subunit TctC
VKVAAFWLPVMLTQEQALEIRVLRRRAIATYQFALVVYPGVKANTVPEFIALVRARPGKISYAAAQGGLMPYTAAIIFIGMTKVDMLHVASKNVGAIYNDLLSGQVDSHFATPWLPSCRISAAASCGLWG